MSYRKASIAPEELFQTVERVATSPLMSAAAAVALHGWIGPAERKRFETAARASVEPRLRIALDAAASAEIDDATLERALAELEAEELAARVES
jgi:hypothetical protein